MKESLGMTFTTHVKPVMAGEITKITTFIHNVNELIDGSETETINTLYVKDYVTDNVYTVHVSKNFMAMRSPQVGGYYIVNFDGTDDYLNKELFENAYEISTVCKITKIFYNIYNKIKRWA